MTKNAASLAKRLRDGQSIKLVLFEQLEAIEDSRRDALENLSQLAELTSALEPAFVEQASFMFGTPFPDENWGTFFTVILSQSKILLKFCMVSTEN